MITWLSSWAQGIIVAVVIATIVELILPNGNNKKYVKVIVGIYILFTIISPIISKLKNNEFNINEIINTEKYEQKIAKSDNTISSKIESNNSRTIKDIYITNLSTDIKTKLKEKGYDVLNTNIKIKDDETYTIEKISLKINKIENNQEDVEIEENNKIQNINVEEVKIKVGINNSENDIYNGLNYSGDSNNSENADSSNYSGNSNNSDNTNYLDNEENSDNFNNSITLSKIQEIKTYLGSIYDVNVANIELYQ